MAFRDRRHAGALLAPELDRFRGARPIVFGVTRGGVTVAFEVARRLDAPLEPLVVRQVTDPRDPRRAVGAIAEGGGAWIDREALLEAGLGVDDFAALAGYETAELVRRAREYRRGWPLPEVSGRTVIVVDDGIATVAAARAAARTLRRADAVRLVLAAPVIAAPAGRALGDAYDEIVAVELPAEVVRVGAWYERYEEPSSADVVEILRRARRARPDVGAADELWDGEWMEC